MKRTFIKHPKSYVNASGQYPFDDYDNIREDLISLGYNRGYINNLPLWKLRDLYNTEYLGK